MLLKRDCLKSRRHLLLQSSLIFHTMSFQAYLENDRELGSSPEKKCSSLGSVEYFFLCLLIDNLIRITLLVLSTFEEIWPPSEKA